MAKLNLLLVSGLALTLSLCGCSRPRDPVERMLQDTREMIKLAIAHGDNCPKAVEELSGYVLKHDAAWKELSQRSREQESKLSAEDKKKYEAKVMEKVKDFLAATLPARLELEKKCPGQLTQLGDSFGKALKTFQ